MFLVPSFCSGRGIAQLDHLQRAACSRRAKNECKASMAPILLVLALPCAAASLRAQILAAELKREAPFLAQMPEGMQAALRPPADGRGGRRRGRGPALRLPGRRADRGVASGRRRRDHLLRLHGGGAAAANGVEPPGTARAPPDGEEWLSGPRPALACLSESDAGIATAEQLSNLLGCTFRNAVSPS